MTSPPGAAWVAAARDPGIEGFGRHVAGGGRARAMGAVPRAVEEGRIGDHRGESVGAEAGGGAGAAGCGEIER